jgi:hypothetical protein
MNAQEAKLKQALDLTDDELAELTELGVVVPGQLRKVDPDDLSEGLRVKAAQYLPEPAQTG